MAHGEALRIRVIKAVVEDGLSRNEAARIFRVGIASAIRWVTAFEETRRTAPLPTGGDRRSVLKPHRNWLVELRRKENDLTLDAITERLLRTHGVEADKSMLSRFFAAELDFGRSKRRGRGRFAYAARYCGEFRCGRGSAVTRKKSDAPIFRGVRQRLRR